MKINLNIYIFGIILFILCGFIFTGCPATDEPEPTPLPVHTIQVTERDVPGSAGAFPREHACPVLGGEGLVGHKGRGRADPG